jgi:KDO2-lipid IV(A) lauroyltransferase
MAGRLAGRGLRDKAEPGRATAALAAFGARPSGRYARGVRDAFDYGVYLALRAAWAIARAIPLPILRRALEAAGLLTYALDVRHRRVTFENLALAFPEWPHAKRVEVAREAFKNWARIAAELVHAREMARGRTLEGVRAMQERAAELGRDGRGVLALTAHTGNFELLARLLGHVGGRRVVVFHRRMANRFVGDFLQAERSAMNVGTLGRGIVVREALRVLERGDILVVPLDQNQSRKRGVFVDFFGQPACTSTMLARLSLSTGLSVQPAFAVWEGDDLIPLLGEAIAPPAATPAKMRAETVRDLTERYTREVEAVIRRHPGQWNWAHRRWKTKPEPIPTLADPAAVA